MISCSLQGGIGNQLFQIAAAHALALRNNDISGFDLDSCHTPLQGNTSNKYRNSILSKINSINRHYKFNKVYVEPRFSYNQIPYHEDLLLTGYFQSETYFSDFSNEIKVLFEIPNEINTKVSEFINEIKRDELTSIHVRRGDYLKLSDYHSICSVEYYNIAMSMFTGNFVIISDDIEWCKANFKGDNISFSPFVDDVEDLALTTLCDNNIIANSSFSWWGAYLNKNPHKKIVAPKKWFGPKGPQDQEDIIPNTWIKI